MAFDRIERMQYIDLKSFRLAQRESTSRRQPYADDGTNRARLRDRLSPMDRAAMDRWGVRIGVIYLLAAMLLFGLAAWDAISR